MRKADRFDPEHYFFRGLHPNICIGTASDRYGGWIGQIYTELRYEGRITNRTTQVGGKKFKAPLLPVESVSEYFEHFRTLEIDYTFYRPLLGKDGKPSPNYIVLQKYAQNLSEGDGLLLKVPQAVFAQKLRRGSRLIANEDYLDATLFTRQFYEPAVEILGPHLRGMVFEQEYQKKDERLPPDEMAGALELFFSSIPSDHRYHVELRTEPYLCEPVFEVFEKYGIGQVLSHWTWLPPLPKQLDLAGGRFFNDDVVVRLMTPLKVRYEDAYARAHPFDKLVEGMMQPQMIEQTAGLMRRAIEGKARMHVIINNRAGGNAPMIARRLVEKYLEEEASG